MSLSPTFVFFFFNDTATTEIYTLSLHDALPILDLGHQAIGYMCKSTEDQHEDHYFVLARTAGYHGALQKIMVLDRKSTRLNSSHPSISYAVFCLKKKKK